MVTDAHVTRSVGDGVPALEAFRAGFDARPRGALVGRAVLVL